MILYLVILLMMSVSGLVNNSPVVILMYTDLIQVSGSRGTCSDPSTSSTNNSAGSTADIAITLSRFSFYETNASFSRGNEQSCAEIEIMQHHFNYDWTCFSTGNGSDQLSDSYWLFFNCTSSRFISTECLPGDVVGEDVGQLCDANNSDKTCRSFTNSANGKRHIYECSRIFAIEHKSNITDEALRSIDETKEKLSLLKPLDIIAIACAGFILVAFLLAMFIPERKCRIRYQYDEDSGLRVPLEIYEMCGVKYKPSAKRKLTQDPVNWIRKMSHVPFQSRNLAIVAILDDIADTNKLADIQNKNTQDETNKNEQDNVADKQAEFVSDTNSLPIIITDDVTTEQPDDSTDKRLTNGYKGTKRVSFATIDMERSLELVSESELLRAPSVVSVHSDTCNTTEQRADDANERRHIMC